jgi:putative ABC transport system substrate-binding protein
MAVGGTPVPIAMKRATSTIPIVFGIGFDPVSLKLVDSLARPGGNATGAMLVASALEGKRIELLKEMQPALRSVALLGNSTSPMIDQLAGDAEHAAAAFGVTIHLAKVATVPSSMPRWRTSRYAGRAGWQSRSTAS